MLYFKKMKGGDTVGNEQKIKELINLGIDKIPEIHYYKTTDSTNARAKEFAKLRNTGADVPVVFIAEEQTRGRGRLGRSFHSARGGVYISFLFYPKATAEKATAITAYAAVILSRVVKSLAGIEPKIKWVNDLYLDERKLAGILTEGEISQDGSLTYAVCGIGINLSKKAIPAELSSVATSVEEATGISLDPMLVAARITDAFISDADDFLSPRFFEEYKRLSLTLGRDVTVCSEPSYDGVASDILPDYSLLVATDSGIRRVFTGEVSIRHKKQ